MKLESNSSVKNFTYLALTFLWGIHPIELLHNARARARTHTHTHTRARIGYKYMYINFFY